MKIKSVYVIITFLIIANIILLYNNLNLESKFETLKEANIRLSENKTITDKQISIREFKEQSYIRQQERDTTLILFFFTIAIGLTSYFTYEKTISKINSYQEKLRKKYRKGKEKYNDLENKINKLSGDLYIQRFEFLYDYARDSLKNNDTNRYATRLLVALEKLCLSKNFSGHYPVETINLIDRNIKVVLNELYEFINSQEASEKKFIIKNTSLLTHKNRYNNISEVLDKTEVKKFIEIFARFDLDDTEN